MTDCNDEEVVTMMDVLQEQQAFEEDANAVLGASDEKDCTYQKGYIKRQAIYACLTCCPDAKDDPSKRAGVCLACSLNCHENHDLVELYTKRNFRCDCGNSKFGTQTCQFVQSKDDLNEDNKYDQNFSGLYCVCHRPYPDPEFPKEDDMIQCNICEDWLHGDHLEATIPDDFSEMICKGCMLKNEFLHDYSELALNIELEVANVSNVDDVNDSISINDCSSILDQPSTNSTEVKSSADIKEAANDMEVDEQENKDSDEKKIEDTTTNSTIDNETKDASSAEHDKSNIVESSLDENNSNIQTPTSEPDIDNGQETEGEIMTISQKIEDGSVDKTNEKCDEQDKNSENSVDIESSKNNELENDSMPVDEPKEQENETTTGNLKDNNSADLDRSAENQETNVENKELIDNHNNSKEISDISLEQSSDNANVDGKTENKDINESITSLILESKDNDIATVKPNLEENPETEPKTDLSENDINKDEDINAKLANTESSGENEVNKDNKEERSMETDELEPKPQSPVNNVCTSDDKEILSEKELLEEQSAPEVIGQDESKTIGNKPDEDVNIETNKDNDISNESENNIKDEVKGTSVNTTSENTDESLANDSTNEQSCIIEKRKLSIDALEPITNKKAKHDDSTQCVRPKGVSKKYIGATFWPSNFRQKLCKCNACITMYKDLSVLFLIDPDDTVLAYETLGKEKLNGGSGSQYERGLEALSSLDRTQQVNAITEYNLMKDKLLEYLKSFKDRKEIVKEEDIEAFFAGMKPKREPDGVYFCR